VVSRYQRRKCAALLNVQEYAGEKKIDMGENLQPTHCQFQYISTSGIHVCRFERRPKLASLKTSFSIVWECAASLNAREHGGEKKIDMGENFQPTDFLIRWTS